MKTQNVINPVREHLKHLALAAAVAVGLGSASVQATTLTWAMAGNGAWDTAAANWTGATTTFTNGDEVIFDNAVDGTIAIASGIAPASTTVSATGGTYVFSGNPVAAGSLTKSGGGTLSLNVTPANFSSTVVNGGTLFLQAETGFGLGPVTMTDVTVNSGGVLRSHRANITGNLTMDGGTYAENSGWNGSWSGSIYLASNSNFRADGFGRQNLLATISGPGGLIWNGPHGEGVDMNGANTYTGNTVIQSGEIHINNGLTLQNSALDTTGGGKATMGSPNPYDYYSPPATPTFGGLIGGGNLATVISSGYGSVTSLTLNPGPGVTNTYSGVIADGATGMALVKAGTGIQVLSGANSYTGPTTVSNGVLRLSSPGVLPASTVLTLDGGTLDLPFSGNEQVAGAYYNGVALGVGLYDHSQIPAITGTGQLLVGNPIVAGYTAAPNSGPAPLQVVFTDTSSSYFGTVNSWSWNFGDGTASSARNPPAHTYPLWGLYTVTLTVGDTTGYSATTTQTLTVTQPLNLVVNSEGQFENSIVNVGPTNTVTFGTGLGGNPDFGGLTGRGTFALKDSANAAVTLEVGSNTLANSTFAGVLTGAGGLTKVGTNTLTLSGSNAYLGETVISGGTLQLLAAGAPGLYEGLVTQGGGWDTTAPIPQTTVRLSDRMADTDQDWTDNTTWGYSGYFNNPAPTDVEFTFGKAFDDDGLIKIDGAALINSTSWNTFVTAKQTLSPGWHTLELRVGQGGGGVGPQGNMKDNGLSVGLGWSTDGGTTWHGFSDPGDGTVLATGIGGSAILPAGTTLRINSPGILNMAGGANTVTKLYLGGIGQAAGTWGSTASTATNQNNTYFSGTGVLTVTSSASGGTTYADWASVNAPGETATDDHDHDGVSNGLEYVLGGTKNTNDLDKLPKLSADGTKFTFELPASSASTGTALRIEFSTDLNDWTTHAGTDIAPGVSGPVEVTIPSLGAHTFARLKVTLN